jgi:hypothetical protein
LSAECTAVREYRSRRPQATPLYRLVEAHFEEVKGQWEERLLVAFGAGDP